MMICQTTVFVLIGSWICFIVKSETRKYKLTARISCVFSGKGIMDTRKRVNLKTKHVASIPAFLFKNYFKTVTKNLIQLVYVNHPLSI